MNVARNVILDLLPLYLANEVSAETRSLVEKHLETDPELAKIAEQSAAMDLREDIPATLAKEDKMEAYEEAKHMLQRRTMIWATLIAIALLSVLGLALLAYVFLTSAT